MTSSQDGGDLVGGAVPALDPNRFRRGAEQEAPLVEIRVFGNDHKVMLGGVVPDRLVVCCLQLDVAHMD